MTLRLEVETGREDEVARYLAREALPAAFDRPGVLGAHFGVADRSGSALLTEEKKARGGGTLVPGWVVLIEGISAAAVEGAAEHALGTAALHDHGIVDPIERGVYRLECWRAKTAFTVG